MIAFPKMIGKPQLRLLMLPWISSWILGLIAMLFHIRCLINFHRDINRTASTKPSWKCMTGVELHSGVRRVRLVCKNKRGFTPIDFFLIGKDLWSFLGWKSCLELGLRKRIYSLKSHKKPSSQTSLKAGGIKGVHHNIQFVPIAAPVIRPSNKVPLWASYRELRSWELSKSVVNPLPDYSLVVSKKKISRSGYAWIPATSIMQPCIHTFPCRLTKMSSVEYPMQKC